VWAEDLGHRRHDLSSFTYAVVAAAIWFVTSQKNGVSARGWQDTLGFGSYQTAYAQTAAREPLDGNGDRRLLRSPARPPWLRPPRKLWPSPRLVALMSSSASTGSIGRVDACSGVF
jgi:hypothetical protein